MSYFLKLFQAATADPDISIEASGPADPSCDSDADPVWVGDTLYRIQVVASTDGDVDSAADAIPGVRSLFPRLDAEVGPDYDPNGGFCA